MIAARIIDGRKLLIDFITNYQRFTMMPTTETEESSKLERLQMRRKGYQTFVMRLIQEFNEICEAETHDYERIEIIDQHLQDKQKLIDALNENVLTLCDVGDIIGEIEQSEQTNDLILSKRKRIKAMLTNRDKLCSKVKANKNESTESQSIGSTETHQAGSSETQPTGSNESQHGIYINEEILNDETQQQDDGVNVQTPNVNMEQQQYVNYSPSSVANQQHLNFTAKPRLPKITLPRFNGMLQNGIHSGTPLILPSIPIQILPTSTSSTT